MQNIVKNYEELRLDVIKNDKRFSEKNGHLCFEGVDVVSLAKKYGTPFYVYSEKEINRNIDEIKEAFKSHPKTKIFFASKACSVMGVLKAVKDAGICVEANSLYEVKKALEIGFKGEQIVFNGVVKKAKDLEVAIANDLYLINVDSEYELDTIEEISTRLKKVANVCVRIEPSVKAEGTHEQLDTSFHAKAGLDREQAVGVCKRILKMPYVKLKGLHMHVGDQLPVVEPFADACRVLVEESMSIEKELGIKFELINVGGGISTAYKYEKDHIKTLESNMHIGFSAKDFANAMINEIHKWNKDIEICIEPGRKVVGSAAIMIAELSCQKNKTLHPLKEGDPTTHIEWKFIDAGYSILSDSQHFNWFFYVYNASRIKDAHDTSVRLAGPLCDGGDWFKVGTNGDREFLLPKDSTVGDYIVFIDAGAYSIESQTTYNNRPRTAVVMIDKDGNDRLIRREDTYADILAYDIY